jgi:type VI secretion system protein ImpC
MNEIMHAPEFQQIESAWRGLKYLVFQSETDATLKIKLMNVSKDELYKHLRQYPNAAWDQSPLFKKIYEEEFGTLGGQPFGCLIGDYSFSHLPKDVQLLRDLSKIAGAAHAPFFAAADAALMNMDSWNELMNPRDLSKLFDAPDYIAWRSLRDSEDARYVGLCMPRVLARLPYGAKTEPVDEFAFEEDTDGHKGEKYAWMNAAYAMAANINRAFKEYGWCARIRGVQSGGEVEDLPTHISPTDDGGVDQKCPTEIAITDRRDAELSKLGFLPLCHYKNTDYSVFFGGQTVKKPKQFTSPKDTANSEISARLPYIMASSRIAHFLKMIARDKIGSFMEASDCQDWLNRWISQYVLADDKPSEEMKKRFPLSEAKIEVREIPGNPGAYNATALLRPWLQMEELNAALSMVAEIPKQ